MEFSDNGKKMEHIQEQLKRTEAFLMRLKPNSEKRFLKL